MPKSKFERAASQFGTLRDKKEALVMIGGSRMIFRDLGGTIECDYKHHEVCGGVFSAAGDVTVGDVCKFMSKCISEVTRRGDPPPACLKGATASGSFEDLLTKEGDRLEKSEVLTLGRYPVASVVMKGSKFPMQLPSLPDFEGVLPEGRQFIIEAKVCARGAFEITKDKLKPKQVRHMLKRSRFGVPSYLLIHFNEREGKTFYSPAFTVGIPVKPRSMGGLVAWESFAADKKGLYAGSISREEAGEIGREMLWHTPPRCRSPRPDIEDFLRREKVIDEP